MNSLVRKVNDVYAEGMSNTQIIRKWDRFNYNGEQVEVIAVDSDPTALVMVIKVSDPDIALYVARTSLVAL